MQKSSKKLKKKALISIAPGTPLRQFRKFKDLPYEIRQQIWDEAARLPRIVGITFTTKRISYVGCDHSLTSKTKRSPLLKTCSASRRAALAMEAAIPHELDWFQWGNAGQKVYFNCELDTIVVSSPSILRLCEATREPWMDEKSHYHCLDRWDMKGTGWAEIKRMSLIFKPYDTQSARLSGIQKWVFTGLKEPIKRLLLKQTSAFIVNNGLGYMLDQKFYPWD